MYDREQRLKMEFALQRFRVAQASLWREDVRDLISLSEYKMHIYLLVNVLLLGFTIVLWCEGRLPSDTPDWLMMGSALSITGAFMFLLLSMWLAMHAAVAARSYETRLLTQLVRLPIPSWEEIEACRTYGSDFERNDAKQIFRLPFLTGRQEKLVKTTDDDEPLVPPPITEARLRERDIPSVEQCFEDSTTSSTCSTPETLPRTSMLNRLPPMETEAPKSADPWGFERSGEDIYELGSHHGSQVAKLRHIRLARQAMVYWQTYDAFSRISLSNGINQLLLALSYYMLGYILIEVGCRTAATQGVIVLCALAEAMAKLDMSMSIWQLRQIQFLLAFGPIMSLIAATVYSHQCFKVAEVLIVLSFVSHGVLLMMMIRLCYFDPQDHGAPLPTTFRGVLYLDVFGWLKTSPQEASNRTDPALREGPAQTSTEGVQRPALAMTKTANGRTTPLRPEDLAKGVAHDLRNLPGAPSLTQPSTQFYDAEFWLAGDKDDDGDERSHRDFAPIVTGHEKEVPRILPYRTFCVFAVALSIAWILAAVHHILVVNHIWDFWAFEEMNFEDLEPYTPPESLLQMPRRAEPKKRVPVSLFGMRANAGSRRGETKLPNFPEQTAVSWPHANIQPVGVSCDAAGRMFVVTDGFLLYSGTLVGSKINFTQLHCPAVGGEGLQDVSLTCAPGGRDCSVQVLHRHGRRLATCALNATSSSTVLSVSDKWLEQVRRQRTAETEKVEDLRTRAEKVVSLATDTSCNITGEAKCAYVGTTYGRIVQLRGKDGSSELLPTSVVRNRASGKLPGLQSPGRIPLSTLGHQGRLGLLQEADDRQSILILNGQMGGSALGRLAVPQPSVTAMCAGGGYLHFLLRGTSPAMLRVPLPREFSY